MTAVEVAAAAVVIAAVMVVAVVVVVSDVGGERGRRTAVTVAAALTAAVVDSAAAAVVARLVRACVCYARARHERIIITTATDSPLPPFSASSRYVCVPASISRRTCVFVCVNVCVRARVFVLVCVRTVHVQRGSNVCAPTRARAWFTAR